MCVLSPIHPNVPLPEQAKSQEKDLMEKAHLGATAWILQEAIVEGAPTRAELQ
jgi:hypothetical protein